MKLENLTACALLKEIHFLEDCFDRQLELSFLKTKGGKEIDFLVQKDGKPFVMIEGKWSDDIRSPNFPIFERYLGDVKKIQLVKYCSREKTYPDGTEVRQAHKWLASFSLGADE